MASSPLEAGTEPSVSSEKHQIHRRAARWPTILGALATGGLLLTAGGGCENRRPPPTAVEEVAIPVAKPVRMDVTEFVNFTGRTESVQAVDIHARVTGYLVDSSFKEGSEVTKGETLFVIDPELYDAQVASGEAQVAYVKAQLELAEQNYQRSKTLLKRGGIMQQEFDQNLAARDQAAAQLKSAQAALDIYRLNQRYTRVTAPTSGQISRRYLAVGNLVVQDQTILTTIVRLDPMYVYFDMEEPVLLRIRKAINEGRMKLPEDGDMEVLVGLPGEQGFQHKGMINFINNQVSPTTGSVSVRGVIPNPKPKKGTRLLSPGMFMRIRLPIGKPEPSLLIIDRAISSDQGIKFVYVVDAENRAQYRRVSIGDLQDNGLRVIKPLKRAPDGSIIEGLEPDEWVVVGALQQIRPRTVIRTEPRAMPTTASISPVEPVPTEKADKDKAQR